MTEGPLVAVLAYDGLCTFEFGIAAEIFGLPRPEMGPEWYRYRVCGVEPGPLRAAGGLRVQPDHGLEVLATADLVLVPGWRGIDAEVPDDLIEALKALHRRGGRIASLCSGIVVVAATGLLEGRPATTHWRYAEAVRRRFPGVVLRPAVLYVDNGDIMTAAGSAAGLDLCLHIVRRDFGAAAANRVARRLVVQPHREGGQAQFVESPVRAARGGKPIAVLLDWLRDNLDRPHSIKSLSARAGMSERSFQRHFAAATGRSAGQWLIEERVRRAREALEQGALPLEEIGAQCGFGSPETMRHHFRRVLGISPSSYRKRFSA
jgi:AraC family transcriptional activator FtrA